MMKHVLIAVMFLFLLSGARSALAAEAANEAFTTASCGRQH